MPACAFSKKPSSFFIACMTLFLEILSHKYQLALSRKTLKVFHCVYDLIFWKSTNVSLHFPPEKHSRLSKFLFFPLFFFSTNQICSKGRGTLCESVVRLYFVSGIPEMLQFCPNSAKLESLSAGKAPQIRTEPYLPYRNLS